MSILVVPERRGEEIDILERILRGERVEHYATKRMTKDGHVLDVSLTVSPIHNIHGEIIEASVIARDISGEKRALEALASAKNKELAAEAIRDFVSMVTHDLKTPLTTIAGTTSILRESWSDLDEKDLQRLLDGLHRNSDVMTKMVQDLLLVSRAEAGELDPHTENTEVNEAVRNIVATFANGIELSLPDEPLFVEFDRYHLDRIVSNLISNARAYGAPPVEVTIAANGAVVEISVADHGSGIPDELVPRLFEKFSRAERVRGMQGTGLGLAIVRSLAEANDAGIAYAPNQPQGARFSLRLRRAG